MQLQETVWFTYTLSIQQKKAKNICTCKVFLHMFFVAAVFAQGESLCLHVFQKHAVAWFLKRVPRGLIAPRTYVRA